MADPRKMARQAEEKAKEYEEFESDFITIDRLAKFADGEERILRILPPVEFLKWLLDNPDKTFDDYCSADIGPVTGWREIEMHFNIAGNGVLPCRKMIGEPCPICDAYEEDMQSTDATIKEAANKLRAKTQVAFFLIDRGGDVDTPLVWAVSPKWAKQIYSHCANPDYGILYDPENGHDIRVKRTGTGLRSTYSITPRPKPSFLYSVKGEDEDGPYEEFDFDKIKALVGKLPSISEYNNPVLDYEHYEAVLNGDMTIKEAYGDQFNSDEDTEFDPEEIEKEEEQEEEQPRRRRRRR